MQRGAIHIDWVISIGIFLVYIIVLLVLIKPSYKSVYEGDALTTMIKDEFLIQNKIDAGFVVFTTKGCEKEEPIDIKSRLASQLGVNKNNIYIKPIGGTQYQAFFLKDSVVNSDEFLNCLKEIGEVVYYNGLKEGLNFETKNFNFPSSRNYKITIYQSGKGNEITPTRDDKAVTIVNPTSEAKVYVLDWSAAKLVWDNVKKEIERDNIIINIQVW